MTSKTVIEVEARLKEAFAPTALEIVDNTWMHAGHAGNALGGSHLAIKMVSARFAGIPMLKRHRMVHEALRDLMQARIHALELELKTG